jgi:lysophospholipase L1-like esterase
VTPFDVVVILEGVNDIRGGRTASQVRDALKRMADNARAQGVTVVMTRLTSYKSTDYVDNTDWLPAAQQMNDLIWTLTQQEGLDRVSFDVEMCPDGIHPTDWGYGQMGTAAAAKLQQMFPANPVP